jgi:hypothetical protein
MPEGKVTSATRRPVLEGSAGRRRRRGGVGLRSIAPREAAMAGALREGKSISEVMGASYERMLEK